MKPFYMYILKCSDDSYYTGHTDDIDRRIDEHYQGVVPCYTKNKRPFTVAYVTEFPTRYEALVAELQIKKWTRKKKEALINENWEKLQEFSKKKFKGKLLN